MKGAFIFSSLVVGLQILCLTFETYAIPAAAPSTTTTTQSSENVTKKTANRTVLLAASSLPKFGDLKRGVEQNETNLTAKFTYVHVNPIHKVDDESGDSEVEKLNATQVGKESAIEDGKLTQLAPMSDDDRKVRQAWGGNCTMAVWNVCNKIKWWGGNYVVPDKKNPGKFLVKTYKIQCVEKPDKTFCLHNGWTVARCHMLCMSQCNVEYRQNYDKLVSHEGECKMPIYGKR